MTVYAILRSNPDRVYKTYRTLGAAKGAVTQMGWTTGYSIVKFENPIAVQL